MNAEEKKKQEETTTNAVSEEYLANIKPPTGAAGSFGEVAGLSENGYKRERQRMKGWTFYDLMVHNGNKNSKALQKRWADHMKFRNECWCHGREELHDKQSNPAFRTCHLTHTLVSEGNWEPKESVAAQEEE
tara:strand:+ start:185 stop:580 length:396 start_codon:yes stop_codon:yes gene_type:complete